MGVLLGRSIRRGEKAKVVGTHMWLMWLDEVEGSGVFYVGKDVQITRIIRIIL